MITITREALEKLKKEGARSRPVRKPSKSVEKKEPTKEKTPDLPTINLSGAIALHEKTAKMAQDISISSAEVVSKLAVAMEKAIKAGNEKKPNPYRFVIERDKKGIMKSVTATPMGQKG